MYKTAARFIKNWGYRGSQLTQTVGGLVKCPMCREKTSPASLKIHLYHKHYRDLCANCGAVIEFGTILHHCRSSKNG